MFANVPAGVGQGGKIKVSHRDMDDLLTQGAKWAVANGYGWNEDLEYIEENGMFAGAGG